MHVHVKNDQNEQNNKKRHTVKLYHTKGLHGFTFHRTVNCLKETKKGMSGLNFSTLHKELITFNFKTSLSGVWFQFGVFMTLNYFYTELAGLSLFYYLWYKRSCIRPRWTALQSSWPHWERWLSSEGPSVCPLPTRVQEGCPPHTSSNWASSALGGGIWQARKLHSKHWATE